MNKKNDYLSIYLETINPKLQTKKVKKQISKKNIIKNILIEQKRKAKKRELILEGSDQENDVSCSIDVIVRHFQVFNSGVAPQQILSVANEVLGSQNYKHPDVTDKINDQLKEVIHKSIQSTKQQVEKHDKKFSDKKFDHVYVVIIGTKQNGKQGMPLFFLIYEGKIQQLVPNFDDFLHKILAKLSVYRAKSGDKDYSFWSTTAAVGLIALSAGWTTLKIGGSIVADEFKSLTKDTPAAKWFNKKSKKDGDSDQNEDDQNDDDKKKNYNKQSKKIIAALTKYAKTKGEGYKELSPQIKAKLLHITGIKPSDNMDNVDNFKVLFVQKKTITITQYTQLTDFQQEIAKDAAYNTQVDETQVKQYISDSSEKENEKAYKELKNDKKFQKKCKSLGFRDVKQQAGLAGFFMNLLNKFLNLFGGSEDKKTEADASKIKQACPTIAKNINKRIMPGRYPVFFGNTDGKVLSEDEIKAQFEALNGK